MAVGRVEAVETRKVYALFLAVADFIRHGKGSVEAESLANVCGWSYMSVLTRVSRIEVITFVIAEDAGVGFNVCGVILSRHRR